MRYGGAISAIVLVWLLIGVLAAWQRDYFQSGDTSCGTAGTIALTVIAGPLNYAGVNPRVHCNLTQPSSMPAVGIANHLGMES
jgi:Tfp pilus assembly protein PilW